VIHGIETRILMFGICDIEVPEVAFEFLILD